MAGEELEVVCRASGGNPPPAIRWMLGKRVKEGAKEDIDMETEMTVSRLMLPVMKADQGKMVTCEVVHPALMEEMMAKAELEIQCKFGDSFSILMICLSSSDKPEVSVSSVLPYYVEGDTVSLSCTSEASPSASVMWYRAGSGQIITRQHQLRLEAVTKEQAGGYVCRANNTVGTSEPAMAEITVQCELVVCNI